ncbi:hypothetical protein [Krasilnikovia sp. MM14-A1259]|uniref:hypothetical protein n=1 Tax=Krasilnikovia sp. MM14-A1259 TaxID=3373539 RepID=UPI00399D0ABC
MSYRRSPAIIDRHYAVAMLDASPASATTPATRRTVSVSAPLLLTVVLVAALAGAAAAYLVMSARGVPDIVHGTISGVAEDPHGNITAIAFRFDDHDYVLPGEGESLPVMANVSWTDASGQNHAGDRPACLTGASNGRRMELGVVDLHGKGVWPTQVVVWVHCL